MSLDSFPDMRDRHLLQLFQLFDSQFPVGAFAHSGGLETYGQAGAGLIQLRELLAGQISNGWGRAELAAASLAWRTADAFDSIDALARLATLVSAHKAIPSIHEASVRLGRRTVTLLERLYPRLTSLAAIEPSHHAVVLGAAASALALPLRELLVAYAHSLIAASVAAATRCMRISPAQGQELIIELQPALAAAVSRAVEATEDDLFTSTPGLDIRCHQQGGLTTRLFQS
jgi:urease accessory protein